ncbi:hypothetical protein [Kordia sp.]|uniref:hypothetical protein n=1 Tax=Kordia sp. TaxID=1965332 RepID=UPI0025BB9E8E|nr:hypothetical protein [Kordia sp.]MCH2193731.1 hypothetical protein [Kordia sp.]
MKKIVLIVIICFASCKINNGLSVKENNTIIITEDDRNPFWQYTKNLIFKSGTNKLIENPAKEIIAISDII